MIFRNRTSSSCFAVIVSIDIITSKIEASYYFIRSNWSVECGWAGTSVVFQFSQLFYGFSPHWIENNLLPQQARMGLMHRKAQHDEVTILSEYAMRSIRIVAELVLLVTDEFHDLMLPLARHVVTTKDDGKVAPPWIRLQFVTEER